jgi:hypothetical protein
MRTNLVDRLCLDFEKRYNRTIPDYFDSGLTSEQYDRLEIRHENRFRDSPCFVFSAGEEKVFDMPLVGGEGTFPLKLAGTKWVLKNQQNVVAGAVLKMKAAGAVTAVGLREYLSGKTLEINVRAKGKGSDYKPVGTLRPDGSFELLAQNADILPFMYILERHGTSALVQLGRECVTCLYCGRLLDTAESRRNGYGPDCARMYNIVRDNTDQGVNPFATPSADATLLRNAPYIAVARSLAKSRAPPADGIQSDLSDDQINRRINVRSQQGGDPVALPLWLAGPVGDFHADVAGPDSEDFVYDLPVHHFTLRFLSVFNRYLAEEPNYLVWMGKLITTRANVDNLHRVEALMLLLGDLHFLCLLDLERPVFQEIRAFLAKYYHLTHLLPRYGSGAIPSSDLPKVPLLDDYHRAVATLETAQRDRDGTGAGPGLQLEQISDDGGDGEEEEVVGRVVKQGEGDVGNGESPHGGSPHVETDSGNESDIPLALLVRKRKAKAALEGESVTIGQFKRSRLAAGKVEVWNVDRTGNKKGKKIGLTMAEVKNLYDTYCKK